MKNGANKFTDYSLPRDSYVAFDALTLKDFIIKRLTDEGTFTDQVYEGSNLASIVEIIAYSYHVLLFYLNNTAAESTFTQASIYENMNKIVNLVGYKPTGRQTSICAIRAIASPEIPDNAYMIRKYSYFLVDNIQYTFLEDYEFAKTETGQEEILDELNENAVLYQGTVEEYPVYIAAGEEFETLPIVVQNIVEDDSRFISNGTISVYVKETNTNKFYEYSEAPSIYLANGSDRVYDLRLNENGNYEVKFGNNVFGKQLSENDEVYIYYLLSDGSAGMVSRGAVGGALYTYTTELFESIYNDVKSINSPPPIDAQISSLISFSNPTNSTTIGEAETVETIRERVPAIVSSNLRLVTTRDYKVFLEKELNGVVSSLYVASNEEFLFDYINYFYKISVDPTKTNRVLLNQVNFADSCDFNNVNVFCVPSFTLANDNEIPDFMPTSLKNLIVDITSENKVVGVEVVPRDPVYVAFKLGITNRSNYTASVADACRLRVVRDRNNYVQRDTLKNQVVSIINNFFNPTNNKLGQVISIADLSAEILGIRGVKNIYTVNINENIVYDGISFIAWSPTHPNDDIRVISQDITLPFYKFPYLMYPQTLINYIEIIDE